VQFRRCPRNGKQAKSDRKATAFYAREGDRTGIIKMRLASPETGLRQSGSRDANRQLKALRRATVGRAATVSLPLTILPSPRLAINRG
jgi:hypothetical protein